MSCHFRKMDIPSMTFIFWMLFGKLTSGNPETTKFLATLEVDVSSIPAGHVIIAEENKSVISCGLKCLEDDYCVGFGFIRKPATKCLTVIDRFLQSQIPPDLTGYTYYSKDNKGFPLDCQHYPYNKPGTYLIQLEAGKPIVGLCEPDNDRTWLVFQRRIDGSVDFYRNWADYKTGFGDPSGEFWFGNENLHQLTKDGHYKLKIELTDKDGRVAVVEYGTFINGDEVSNYRLTVGGYTTGDSTGDSFSNHDQMAFSTYDRDNDIGSDRDCAVLHTGAWWYRRCFQSNLNGLYGSEEWGKGIIWSTWTGKTYSMTSVKIMIRKN